MGKCYLKNRLKRFLSLSGFTLMEIVITTVIVSFGFALLLRVLSMAMSADKYFEYRITALNLANERMEEIKNDNFNDINSDLETAGQVKFDFIDERRTTVSILDSADSDGDGLDDLYMKKVEVEVYWTQKGDQHSVKVETILCNY